MAKSIMHSQPQPRPGFWASVKEFLVGREKPDPIRELMYLRAMEVQRGEYDAIGQITLICTAAGSITFPARHGPYLARFHSDSQVDLIDAWEWEGLPTVYEATDELCPDCKVPCVECNDIEATGHRPQATAEGTGRDWEKEFRAFYGPLAPSESHTGAHLVTGERAGGGSPDLPPGNAIKVGNYVLYSRKILIAGKQKEFLPGKRPCIYGDQTQCCGGIGVIKNQNNRTCPSCGGTGEVDCGKCQGTGLMSSGKTAAGKSCKSCGGASFIRREIKQNLQDHLHRSIEAPPALPLLSMWLHGADRFTQVWLGKPDVQGRYPHIISDFKPGSRAVILGGILRPEQITKVLTRSQETVNRVIARDRTGSP